MIYCVSFQEVHLRLLFLGFEEVGRTEEFRAYERSDGGRFLIRPPNMHGYLPEIIVDDAFASASLDPGRWHVFWGD